MLSVLAGCAASQRKVSFRDTSVAAIGASLEGQPIAAYTFGNAQVTALIIGGIHGSEPASATLAESLISYLEPKHYRTSRIVIVPRANPDGLEKRQRHNINGIDLNRNFPAGNHGAAAHGGVQPLSEPESRALHELVLDVQPALVIALHQPLSCVDYDGPAQAQAQWLSRQVNLPVRKLGSRPGSMGSWVGNDLGIPIITLELPKGATGLSEEELWQAYGPGILGLISGQWIEAK